MDRIFRPIAKPVNSSGQPMMEPERVIETRGLWSNGTGELLTFFTSSLQSSSSREYYYEIWSSASLECEDAQIFSVTYGHIDGSGSLSQGGEIGDTPSRSIYSQYRLLCLDPNERIFYLSGSVPMYDFYAINFNRSRVGDKLDPGNFELCIAELNGGAHVNSAFTGSNVAISSSNKIITLIDDSSDKSDSLGYNGIPSPVRNLVSGSLANGIYNPSNPQYYGLVYADLGAIILSADVLNQSASFNTVTGSNINGDNSMKLFKSISGSATKDFGFTARAVDVKQQDFYFVRISNSDFNYATNPTYVTSDGNLNGILSYPSFVNEPITYITSIGLYDFDYNLLAVAKLSQPLQKSFNSELSITVKLEY